MPDPAALDALDALVVRAQGGDVQAFHDLVVSAQAEVRLFAAARAPSLKMAGEAVQAGIVRTYVYEFIESFSDPAQGNAEAHFGLLRNDGSEKSAYRDLREVLNLKTASAAHLRRCTKLEMA